MGLKRKKTSEGEAAPGAGVAPRRNKTPSEKPERSAKSPSRKGGRRFVLIIGDEGAILIFMQGAKVVRRLFAPSAQPSHTETIREIMAANPRVPLYVLVDVLDQQYVPHTFPPVSSLSVGGLVKRRLDRDFHADDLKGSLSLGRDKGGRKEWKYLLVGLAKSELLTSWIDSLVELPNEMKGIYLVPVEVANYIALLMKKVPQEKPLDWKLFISHNKVSGFRQVVMHRGKLVFTRVSQAIDDAVAAVIAGNIEQEIINTIEYLKRLGFNENAELEVFVVASHDVNDSLDLNRFGLGGVHAFSPLMVAETLGLEQAALSADRFGDVVMASAFGISKKHNLRFATAYMERLSKLYKAQLGVRIVGVLATLALIVAIGATIFGVFEDRAKISDAETKLGNLGPELKRVQNQVDRLNQNVAFKTALAATYDGYLKDVPTPQEFARDIMPFVTEQHRIVNVEWAYAAADKAPAAGTLPLEVKAEFDFAGVGGTAETLTKAADTMIEEMKVKLPKYEVVPEVYPWKKDEPKQEEISFDLSQTSTVELPKETIVKIAFKGPKAASSNGSVVPGGVPPGGQP